MKSGEKDILGAKSYKEVSPQEITHIAKLARLELSPEEVQNYSQQLSKALGYFQQISEVNTSGIEPLLTPTKIDNVLRQDEVTKNLTVEEILQNAPHKTGNLFTVPPVV